MKMYERLNSTLYSIQKSAIREFSRLAGETPGCISLTLGEPDFDTAEEICRKVTESLARGETHYIENSGTKRLRRAIAEFEHEHSNLNYSEREVIVTAGATEAIFISLFGILNPGDEVIVPTPAFPLYEQIIALCRGIFVPLDTSEDGFEIRENKLKAQITRRTKAIILNTPNNPTGRIYSQSSLNAVRNAAREHNLFVLCDDVYKQLSYSPTPNFSDFKELRDRILVIQSFSKPYAMTGWRMGYLLGDRLIIEQLERIHQYSVTSTPAPFQEACIEALKTDPSPMVESYQKRRDYALFRLREMDLEVLTPQGAFYLFPSIRKFGLSSAEFCTRMITEAGVAATPGFCFGSDSHIRISYCCSDEQLKDGFDRMERFIRAL